MSDEQTGDELKRAAAHAVTAAQLAIHEHPIAAVAASAGAGYILAAGVPSWLVRAGATIAMRTVAREVASVALDTIAANKAEANGDENIDENTRQEASGSSGSPQAARAPGPASQVDTATPPA